MREKVFIYHLSADSFIDAVSPRVMTATGRRIGMPWFEVDGRFSEKMRLIRMVIGADGQQ